MENLQIKWNDAHWTVIGREILRSDEKEFEHFVLVRLRKNTKLVDCRYGRYLLDVSSKEFEVIGHEDIPIPMKHRWSLDKWN